MGIVSAAGPGNSTAPTRSGCSYPRIRVVTAARSKDVIPRRARAARGVYLISGSVATWEQRLLAAVMATGHGAAASRRSAAALWRLPGFRRGPIEVTQARGPSSRNPGQRLHDSRFLPA